MTVTRFKTKLKANKPHFFCLPLLCISSTVLELWEEKLAQGWVLSAHALGISPSVLVHSAALLMFPQSKWQDR